jgi:hypothetical protein
MSFVIILGAVAFTPSVGIFALAAYARRGESRADLPGARTVACFKADDVYTTLDERTNEEREGSAARGEGLLSALAGELSRAGLSVENVGPDDYGFGAALRLHTKRGYLRLGLSVDGAAVEDWVVLDQRSGGPGPTELLPHIDQALRNLKGVSDIRRHSRERHLVGDHSMPGVKPLEPQALG